MFQKPEWPSPQECDVTKPNRLERFQACIVKARTALAAQDVNSVESQLTELAWQDAIYRSFNECLRVNLRRKKPLQQPASLIELIHERYLHAQAVYLRRLFELPAANAARGVCSLPTVLALIRRSRDSFCREAFVCYDCTPYAPKLMQSSPKDYMVSRSRHKSFDLFTQTAGRTRSRDDELDERILDRLACWHRLESGPGHRAESDPPRARSLAKQPS